ncbi:unnamed protein product, partial [Medioppia subpectinata]
MSPLSGERAESISCFDNVISFAVRFLFPQTSVNFVLNLCFFVSICLHTCADRPGLRNTDLVHKINRKLDDVLQKAISSSHPENPNLFNELKKKIPDLKTLNTLHSEKLLAYKMEPRNGQTDGQNGESAQNVCNYSNLFPEQWTQLAMIGASNHPNKHLDEEMSTGSPAQASHHDWSGSDSKDGNEGSFGSPRSISSNGMSTDESLMRSNSISSANSLYHSSRLQTPYHINRCPKMASASLSSTSDEHHNGLANSDDCYYRIDSQLKNQLTAGMTAIGNSGANYNKIRRVDSPTDSGIESGKEHGNGSTPTTSVCSSPRSAMDDKVKDVSDSESNEKHESIDDMPMLKRALQAPPLVNTNKLMDEAYRHHKKFRAAQRKDEPHSPSTTTSIAPSNPIQESLATSHSTLLKTLEQPSRYMNEQQLKRTDLIHNIIMRTEAASTTTSSSNWKSGRHSEMSSTGGHLAQSLTNGNYMYPNVSQMSANHVTSNGHSTVQSLLSGGHQQQSKGVVVCPPGLYIPSGYPSSNSCPYSRTAKPLSSMMSSTTAQQTPQQPSRIVYSNSLEAQHHHNSHNNNAYVQHNRRSPSSTSSAAALVMGSTPSPSQGSAQHMPRMGCGSEPSITAILLSQSGNDCADTQPLNLSKKPSPPNSPTAANAIKIES